MAIAENQPAPTPAPAAAPTTPETAPQLPLDTPPASTPAPTAAPTPAPEPAPADWRAGITDEKHREFAGRHTTPADLAKTAFELRQKVSNFETNAVTVPGAEATPEQIKEFRARIGVPDAPTGYEVGLPEDLPEELKPGEGDPLLSEFLGRMHEVGAAPDVVKQATDWFYGYVAKTAGKRQQDAIEARQNSEAELRKAWGADFEANQNHARKAVQEFGDDDFKAFVNSKTIDGVPLGNHPVFTRAFAVIGRRMGEDTLHVGISGDQRKSAEDQINTLTTAAHDARQKGDTAESDRLFRERDQLTAKIYGTGSVVGADARNV